MNTALVKVYVFANSKKEKVRKIDEDVFEIYVKEPPRQNMANRRIAEILSVEYGVDKRCVKLITGHKSPRKKFEISF